MTTDGDVTAARTRLDDLLRRIDAVTAPDAGYGWLGADEEWWTVDAEWRDALDAGDWITWPDTDEPTAAAAEHGGHTEPSHGIMQTTPTPNNIRDPTTNAIAAMNIFLGRPRGTRTIATTNPRQSTTERWIRRMFTDEP